MTDTDVSTRTELTQFEAALGVYRCLGNIVTDALASSDYSPNRQPIFQTRTTMSLTTFTIESVHGIKQTLSLENFTVGPQTKSPSTVANLAEASSDLRARPEMIGKEYRMIGKEYRK